MSTALSHLPRVLAGALVLGLVTLSAVTAHAQSDVTAPGDPVTATTGFSPPAEVASKAIDNDTGTKYYNTDKLNTGFTVTPSLGASVVTGARFATANDVPARDPLTFTLSGSNDGGTTFTPIVTGAGTGLSTDLGRQAYGAAQTFSNAVAYKTYRIIFPTVRDASTADAMQVSEVELLGTKATSTVAVTNTNDSGAGSLRAAINFANSSAGADIITFAIPGAGVNDVYRYISLASALPALTDNSTTIDGYTQGDAKANTLASGYNAVFNVQVAGGSSYNALSISAANCTIRGLAITGSDSGISISGTGATGNKVTGNAIGVSFRNSLSGAAAPNRQGVSINNAAGNIIGGTTVGERNLLSGNSANGVNITGSAATGNTVIGNFIGTDVNGTGEIPNNGGITIQDASNNIIGGTTVSERNIISGSNGAGIYIIGASGNKVSGNYIGTNATGTGAIANYVGIRFLGTGASNNTIGGTTAGERNIISGNSTTGIEMIDAGASGNKVSGNFIGTAADGTTRLANDVGIDIYSPSNTIGGTTAGGRNVLSGNTTAGVRINPGASGNKVSGNFIGTNLTGNVALPNSYGVYFMGNAIGASILNNTVGGTTTGERNILSGNTSAGVYINGSLASGNKVTGNTIGRGADGTTAVANGVGVLVTNAVSNTIGGVGAGAGNIIAGNSGDGVSITGTSTGVSVRGNSITGNGTTAAHLGIDLVGADGVNANDAGDADTGANGLQNFPVLSAAFANGGNSTLIGSLNSTASSTFALDFYSNASADTSGYGEGQTYLGSTTVTTDGSGNASFTAVVPSVRLASGLSISATATASDGSTSEFCQNITSSATAAAGGVVISEFRLSGPNGAQDEYIELFNPTSSAIQLTNWTLSASKVTTALTGLSLSSRTIPASGHLLIINKDGYSLDSGATAYPSTYPTGSTRPASYATGDVAYSGDIALDSTLILRNGDTIADVVGNLSGAVGLVSTNQYAFVRRMDGAVGIVDTGTDQNDFNLVDTASINGPPTVDGLSNLANGARLGAPGPQNAAAPNQRATLTLVPLDPATNQGIAPDGRYPSRGSNIDPFGRLTLRRTLTNFSNQTIKQIRFILVRTTTGDSADANAADLRAITSVGVSANGSKVVQGIQIEAPTSPTTPSNQLSNSDTGNGGGLNSSWNVGTLPNGGLLPGQSMNVEFVFGIVRLGNYNTSIVIQTAS